MYSMPGWSAVSSCFILLGAGIIECVAFSFNTKFSLKNAKLGLGLQLIIGRMIAEHP